MWKDLTLKEKAEIMKMSVANGVTDINDIQALYDDSIDDSVYAEGGHIYKNAGPLNKGKQQPKYQYGIIEQILRENGVNFRVTSGKRKPNQAGNAGKGSAHTYTIFGNSPGAIDIVPGVGSDWNTLFTQMNSPKVRSALAAYGLDVLNETNPSVMASTKATGPHLHVGRGIKGQSGSGIMYGGTTFGGGKGSYTMPQYSTAGSGNYASMMQQQAMEPITLAGSNATSPWLDYISKIGQQRPVSFNTPIGTPSNLVSNNQINIGPVDFSNIGKVDELMSFVDPYTSKQALEYNLGLDNNALWNSPYLLFNEHSAANGGHIYKNGTPKYGMQRLKDFGLDYPTINVAPIRTAKNKIKLKIKQSKNKIKQSKDKIEQSINSSVEQVGQTLKEDMQVADALAGATLSNVTGNPKYLENSLRRLNRVLDLNKDLEYSEYTPLQLNPNGVILKNAQIASEEDISNQNEEYLKNLNETQLRKLQEKLYKAGLLEKKDIDGIYGQVTQNAFNKYNGKQGKWNASLSANGIDGCAQWVTLKYENATGASSAQNGVTLNAWEMLKNIENHGGTMLYNIYDDNFNNLSTHEEVNARTENAVRNNPIDYSMLSIGDIVGIYMPSSDQWEVALNEGTTKNTHVGIITGFDKEGEPIVEHNIHGKKRIDPISNIGGSAKGTPLVTAAARPNYTGTQVKQLHWDPKKSIYTVDEKYNNAQLEEYMNSMAGISDQIQKLYPQVNMEDAQLAALSVLKRETNFMNNKTSDQSTVSQIKEAAGNVVRSLKGMNDETKSSDLSKLKLSTLSSAEKQLLGIYSKDDLENPTKAGAAALMIMARNMDYFNRLSQQYPDLGITNDDIYNATVLSYNQGMDKLMSLGFNEKGIAPEELEQLRNLSNPSSKIKDVNSSKYKYLGAIGEYLYDELEDPYTPYVAAANDAASKYIKKNGEYIPVRANVNPSNVDYINKSNNNDLQDILNPQFVPIETPTLQELALPNFNVKALGGHLLNTEKRVKKRGVRKS